MTPTYLRRDAAAQYLRLRYGAYTAETLAKLAHLGQGPKFRKLGRYPLYTEADLEAWIESRMNTPKAGTEEGGSKC